MLTRAKKEQLVQEMTDRFSKASLILFTDYKGMDVQTISELRGQLYEKFEDKARYQVAKNTLIRLALRNASYEEEEWKEQVTGTTAILTIVDADPIEAIKIVYDFSKKKKLPVLRGCYLEKVFHDESKIPDLAQLPSREQLIAMVVSGFAAPISGLVYSLNGIISKLVYALNAIKDKKSE
ncbi:MULTISPECIES: 50S ribosomal protein L10 [Kosmotoga]|jgi:large subunit ribosomal protein L10|uniref:Large ribosomal subunit protein uL10 n=1 Tax=Kosmotoga olearia (strain ATCC BAA-1733 / DSM 21960 / TBF 19.5.1) TaxID=521045 RepID=RL10_KOSOT|nr:MULTISPECIES: 50S ribosomal protein L10 [Kosmotoga]C5CGE1.1 RecName: Full=Large ribosomal subunit protein uL10; AltName: Full=50S ribosomal protein L10 [Kosmotoga olearia TBF 19.5.1]ACR80522.1 ribosomal protein L10 [Kosmotoga olearia TBF 19.5.1]MDI3523347.1 large subunit ribosomal protein [Kosmotoga sp.]MDK2953569.1 large subunit ribosomal protein [Kosmotoga sp.]OAA19391.1 50S ribosomal protein L10 [Kosmotoga sp. DU53]